MAEDIKKPTTPENDLEREIKKALRIAYEVERWKWLSGAAPMTPPGGWVPIPKPATPAPVPARVHRGAWVCEEARRMKRAGEIPAQITKIEFARMLVDRMRKASVPPLMERYIVNQLEPWGLWPIALIKTST